MRPIVKALVVLLVILFGVSHAAFGGAQKGLRVTKHLPLDGVPGVVLKNRSNSEYLPGIVVVKLMPQATTSLSKTAFGVASIDRVLSRVLGVSTAQLYPKATAKKIGDVDLSQLYAVSYSSPNDPFTISEELSQLPEVQYAEPWFISRVSKEKAFTPNDPLLSFQWGLSKINAQAAWNAQAEGDSTVVIAIVDVGVAWTHPDLAANIWINPGESGLDTSGHDKRSNGKDDDGNGYVDDWHGWDFVGANYATYNPLTTPGDNDPAPTTYNNEGFHGTHVAGIAAAVTNNGIGIASLAHKCKILPVKISADDNAQYILAADQGIVYAAMMGAKVINCSFGGLGGSQADQDAVDFATQRGALVVAAAGNDTSDGFQSPASCRNVLSVASTDPSDARSSYSNYGDYVDVCAPGESIVSAVVFPDGYEFWSGTSMASPFAASLAALVRSIKPNFTALQIGEQVRVTCDNIDASNPDSLRWRLGRGRINALRAVTDFSNPSVRLQSCVINDSPGGNGNGVAESSETLSLVCSFRNFLAPISSGATVQLTSMDTRYITVLQGSFPIGSLGTLDSATNKAAPFRVYVQQTAPQGYTARLQLTYKDGSFTDVEYIRFFVNPTYATHNVNAIEMTLTNNGRIGFYDFPNNFLGKGFIFNGVNFLYEGGLIVGTSSTRLVDVVRNPGLTQDADLSSRGFYALQTPGSISDQDGSATFSDSAASTANRIGLGITMHSYAFSDPLDSKYILLKYEIKNLTSATVSNCYMGIFLDWDIGNDTELVLNYSRYDSTRSLGYAFSGKPGGHREYFGIRALDSASSFRSIVNDLNVDVSRIAKWGWISGGFAQASAGPADIHHVISSGPYTLGPGNTRTVAFALVVGDSSLANIQKNADAAKAKWISINKIVGITDNQTALPLIYSLAQNYPNPFNPTTNFEFRIAKFGLVTLKVFDVLGREITTLVNEMRQAGVYTVRWDASTLPSGVYFYRLRAGDFVETKKMVFAK
jgi:serine protease